MKGDCLTFMCHVWISGHVTWNHNRYCVFVYDCAYRDHIKIDTSCLMQ